MMSSTARRDELLRTLRDQGYVRVTEAAAEMRVDSSTIRRDLVRLEKLGLVRRSHGAALPPRDDVEVPYSVKMSRAVREKKAIGRRVASMIDDGASVILDSGSTSLMVARALAQHRDLTIITPDIQVAAEVINRPNVRLIVPGGESLSPTTTVISQEAVESVRNYRVDVVVLGADAVDPEGASNHGSAVVPLKRAMLEAARRSILVVDSSKIGSRQLVPVCALHEVDQVVTDAGMAPTDLDEYPVPVERVIVDATADVSDGTSHP